MTSSGGTLSRNWNRVIRLSEFGKVSISGMAYECSVSVAEMGGKRQRMQRYPGREYTVHKGREAL